jgi:predicted TIM-barrel fold metal-dependent hydrolase
MVVTPERSQGRDGGQNSAYRPAATLFDMTTPTLRALTLALGLGVLLTGVRAQQPAPSAGALGNRPGANRAPEFPAPSITDYKPRTTLVTAQHPVPKAKYPVIDIHSHQPVPIGAAQFDTVVGAMDQLNLRVLVNASGATGDRLVQGIAAIKASRHANRMVMFSNMNFNDVGPGYGARMARQLEADVKAGALGLGELMKGFGLRAKKADGTRLKVDDPELDPIWEAAGRLKIPVLIHTAEPQEFFQPIDNANERWLELALFRDRRLPEGQFPRFEELMAERDNLFRRHPKTTFVAAHFGWHANDLGRLGKMLDAMPNVHVETGAILAELGRQPRAAHDFFVKYQDRIVFGKDSYQPDEYPYFWRTFESTDEYFDYYRDYHAFWKLYGMGLPDAVLRKLYYQNALRLIPGLPRDGFPR